MNDPVLTPGRDRGGPRTTVFEQPGVAGLVLAALVALSYGSTLAYPFILDDVWAIQRNPSLASLAGAFRPPPDLPVAGRPLLNASFALNHALGGWSVTGYHLFNLTVHFLAAWTVYGLCTGLLTRTVLAERFGRDAPSLALAIAALWAVHPVNTEAVTYLSERAESMMGLFYLATLFFFERGERNRSAGPLALSVAACFLGVFTKEVIVTAPLVVLLYDRTFCAGSFRAAWHRRWGYYLALMASWGPIGWAQLRGTSVGVGLNQGIGVWPCALTACRSLITYLRLCVWPQPLIFDYGRTFIRDFPLAAPYVILVAGLVAGFIWALVRRPVPAFAVGWFLLILAPTTSLVPIAYQPLAEHRVYLSLVAVIAVAVLALYQWAGRRAFLPVVALIVAAAAATFARNRAYASEVSIWQDTASKQPGNARAHINLGTAYANLPGHADDALREDRLAVALDPGYAELHNSIGLLLAGSFHRYPEAAAEFQEAIRLRPGYLEAEDNLGSALTRIPGRLAEATAVLQAVLAQAPRFAKAHNDLGVALATTRGRMEDALAEFAEAVREDPENAEARANLDKARLMLGRSRNR